MTKGTGIFFDGLTSARRAVIVELKSDGVSIRDADELDQLARWPYGELDHIDAHEGVFRLGRVGGKPPLARLELRDAALAHAIDEASVPVDRSGASQRKARMKVVGWSLAAVASLVLLGIYGVPVLADRIAPAVPLPVERALGEAVDTQIRGMLDTKKAGKDFACGFGTGEAAGRAAFEKLVRKLETAAALPIALTVTPVRRDDSNAVALPGGHIYVFQGMIEKSETVDELAGVIAHEIGHVAHRDGTRSILQAAGMSFLFGMLLGDFVGGSAVVLGARALLQTSYSRDVESAADAFAVELMTKVGGDPRGLGTVLARIAGANHPGMKILLKHPATDERVTAINARAPASPGSQHLLETSEWLALKRICAGR